MGIKGLMIDPITNMPIVVLREAEGQRVLPIWVGVFEANAIALQIENVQTPRPMTHDLLKAVIDHLEARSSASWSASSRTTRSTRPSTSSQRRGRSRSTRGRPMPSRSRCGSGARIFVDETVFQNARSVETSRDRWTSVAFRSGWRTFRTTIWASTRCRVGAPAGPQAV